MNSVTDATVIGTVIGGIITAVIGAVIAGIVKIMNARHNHDEETANRSLDEAFRLLEIKDKESSENRKEIHDLREQLQVLANHNTKCEIELARTKEQQAATAQRLQILEEVLRENGFNVPLIDATKGSKVHPKLP